jgi:hypothetical protein
MKPVTVIRKRSVRSASVATAKVHGSVSVSTIKGSSTENEPVMVAHARS